MSKRWNTGNIIGLCSLVATVVTGIVSLTIPEIRQCIGLDSGSCHWLKSDQSQIDSTTVESSSIQSDDQPQIGSITADSSLIKHAVCTYQVGKEALTIDEECTVQEIDNNTTIIKWSNATTTRIELVTNEESFYLSIDGQRVNWSRGNWLGSESPPPLLHCFRWSHTISKEAYAASPSDFQDDILTLCFKFPTQKPKLKNGTYLGAQSNRITIYSNNDKYCWHTHSPRGGSIQSLKKSTTDPNTFIPEVFGGFLYPIDPKNIILSGGDHSGAYNLEWPASEADSTVPDYMQECLDSNQPYYVYCNIGSRSFRDPNPPNARCEPPLDLIYTD